MKIKKGEIPDWQLKKTRKNPKFPYRRYVTCPICKSPLYGSASRGRNGKRYSYYHCNKNRHYFKIPKADFNETINDFVKDVKISMNQEKIEVLKKFILSEWENKQQQQKQDILQVEEKISELHQAARNITEKIKYVTSAIAIKYLEEDLIKIDSQIKDLEKTRENNEKNSTDIDVVTASIGYYLENLEDLLIHDTKPMKKAAYFGLLFNDFPSYEDIQSRNTNLKPFIKLKEESALDYGLMVSRLGLEPRTLCLRGRCSNQLSYRP